MKETISSDLSQIKPIKRLFIFRSIFALILDLFYKHIINQMERFLLPLLFLALLLTPASQTPLMIE